MQKLGLATAAFEHCFHFFSDLPTIQTRAARATVTTEQRFLPHTSGLQICQGICTRLLNFPLLLMSFQQRNSTLPITSSWRRHITTSSEAASSAGFYYLKFANLMLSSSNSVLLFSICFLSSFLFASFEFLGLVPIFKDCFPFLLFILIIFSNHFFLSVSSIIIF